MHRGAYNSVGFFCLCFKVESWSLADGFVLVYVTLRCRQMRVSHLTVPGIDACNGLEILFLKVKQRDNVLTHAYEQCAYG